MPSIKHERTPCVQITDKDIDSLIALNYSSLSLDISVYVLISRFEDENINVKKLSELLQLPEIQIECSIIHLVDLGMLKRLSTN